MHLTWAACGLMKGMTFDLNTMNRGRTKRQIEGNNQRLFSIRVRQKLRNHRASKFNQHRFIEIEETLVLKLQNMIEIKSSKFMLVIKQCLNFQTKASYPKCLSIVNNARNHVIAFDLRI